MGEDLLVFLVISLIASAVCHLSIPGFFRAGILAAAAASAFFHLYLSLTQPRLNPLWPLGMIVSFVLAFILALLSGLVVDVMRQGKRRRPGACRRCGYNLTGNVSGVCPECGKPIATDERVK